MELTHKFFTYSDNPQKKLSWHIWLYFSVYLMFCLAFSFKIFKRFRTQWIFMTEQADKGKLPVQRTTISKALLWLGIDTHSLRGFNPIQVFFIGIFQFLRHVILTTIKTFVVIFKSCNSSLFKFIELLVLALNIQVIASHIKMVMGIKG